MEGEEGRRILSDAANSGALYRILKRAVDVKPDEVSALVTAFAYFFCVLSGWFILRPLRDASAAASGVSALPWLWTGTLAVTLVCNPLFSTLVTRFPTRRFIPITYHFFALNLLGFYVLMRVVAPTEGSTKDLWVGRAFYVWTSMFSLFVVSVFWCFMADVFRSEQAKRLFGFIAVGGTLGSLAGSSLTAVFAQKIGAVNLLLVSIALLELAVLTVLWFPVRADGGSTAVRADEVDRQAIGGSIWAGLTEIGRSPYLLGISAFQVMYTIGSTFLYFQQTDILAHAYADRAARATVIARIEVFVQTLTIITQLFFTGRFIRWLGLALALAFLPLLTMIGFGALSVMPTFAVLAVFIVARRAGNFALHNPAMEVLFTVVKREDKYKAKSLIETFVYRAGDQVAAWTYAGLAALGLGFAGISLTAVPMSAAWLVLGLWLGRRQVAMADEQRAVAPPPGGSPRVPDTSLTPV